MNIKRKYKLVTYDAVMFIKSSGETFSEKVQAWTFNSILGINKGTGKLVYIPTGHFIKDFRAMSTAKVFLNNLYTILDEENAIEDFHVALEIFSKESSKRKNVKSKKPSDTLGIGSVFVFVTTTQSIKYQDEMLVELRKAISELKKNVDFYMEKK